MSARNRGAMSPATRGGQVVLELLWLILFSCAFLSVLSQLYDRGQMEIQSSRIIKSSNK